MTAFASIKGKVFRATRQDSCGNPVIGPSSVVVSGGFTKVDYKREVEAGVEFYVKNAWGDPCVNDIDCSRLKRLALTIDICRIDPCMYELMCGYRLISDQGTGSLLPPVQSALATTATGGTNVPGTYYYVVTAVNANGETVASNERTIVVPAGTNTNVVTVTWVTVAGATGFKIYRGGAPGAELLLATVGLVTTYSDAAPGAPSGAPPATNTTGSNIQIIGNAISENPASCTTGGSFSFEVWSKVAGAGCGSGLGQYKWIHWLIPMARYGMMGDLAIELKDMNAQIMASTIGSVNYGNGPFGQFLPVVGAQEHLLYQLTNVDPPLPQDGYQPLAAYVGTPAAA